MDERHIHPGVTGDVSKTHLLVRILRKSDGRFLQNLFARGVGRPASARSPHCLCTVFPLGHEPITGWFVSNDSAPDQAYRISRENQSKCIVDMTNCIGGAGFPEFSRRGASEGGQAHRKWRPRFDAPQSRLRFRRRFLKRRREKRIRRSGWSVSAC